MHFPNFKTIFATLCCLFLLIKIDIFAQEGNVGNKELDSIFSKFYFFSQQDGLSHPEVYDIIKDSTGYLWIATADGLNRFDGYEFKTYKNITGDSTSLSYNWVWDLHIDAKDRLWVSTRQGLNLYDPQKDNFKQYFNEVKTGTNICGITEYPEGTLWLGTWGGALIKFEVDKNVETSYIVDEKIQYRNYIRKIERDNYGNIWLGTWGGLIQFNSKTENFTYYLDDEHPNCQQIVSVFSKGDSIFAGSLNCPTYLFIKNGTEYVQRSINLPSLYNSSFLLGNSNIFWMGSLNSGLFALGSEDNVYQFVENQTKVGSLFGNTIFSMFQDPSGILWVGTNKGLNVLNPYKNAFRQINRTKSGTIPDDEIVYCFEEDKKGNIWIGTDKGLYELNLANGKHKWWSSPLNFSPIYSLKLLDDKLWMGTLLPALFYFDLAEQKFVEVKPNPEDENTYLKEQLVSLEAKDDNLWIVTGQKDAFIYNLKTNSLKSLYKKGEQESLDVLGFQKVFLDSKNNLWFGSKGVGLRVKMLGEDAYTSFTHSSKDDKSLANNIITAIAEDASGSIWVGTYGGLSRFDSKKNNFVNYTEADGLSSNVISGIIAQNDGSLWISTNKGISSFDEKSGRFTNYDHTDGIQQGIFIPSSCFKDSKENIYFGGNKGLTYFHPKDLKTNNKKPNIVIASIKVMNKERIDLLNQKEIILPYDQNFISFEYTALDFVNPGKNTYSYKLEGLDENWINAGTNRSTNYTGLKPGEYVFRVRAANSHGVWNEEGISMAITINSPWYLTRLAIVFYMLLVSVLFYWYRQYLINREKLKSKIQLKEMESVKLKELDSIKSRFFADISHEFRTPLTIINGVAKKIKNNLDTSNKDRFRYEFDMIDRNGINLLNLANQMLDLAKLESNKLQLQFIQADIISYLEYLSESFLSLSASKNIRLAVYKETDSLIMDFDPEQLNKVVANLLSNAIKNTPEGGSIIFHIVYNPEKNVLIFKVKDSGVGMTPDVQSQIFERFYQGNNTNESSIGAGIGLSLTKELVDLMKGEITVQSKKMEGSEFIVKLPVHNEAVLTKSIVPKTVPVVEIDNKSQEKLIAADDFDNSNPILLLIEDNKDVAYYIESCLKNLYQVNWSENGNNGVIKAKELIPDIIICDVMMPGINGYEVCAQLKENEQTNHIPIVLLTAKSGEESRITGISSGADAYLEKPFNETELIIQLEQLIKSRRQLQEKYRNADIDGMDKIKDKFLDKAISIIKREMHDPKFNTASLAFELKYSESQLYRKIKALSGTSTAIFIRRIRLQGAKSLLQNPEMSISEIAYATGFNNPTWFSSSFKEEFGYSPKELRGS